MKENIPRREARRILASATRAEEHYKPLASTRDIIERIKVKDEWSTTPISLDKVREEFERYRHWKLSRYTDDPEVFWIRVPNPYALQNYVIFTS